MFFTDENSDQSARNMANLWYPAKHAFLAMFSWQVYTTIHKYIYIHNCIYIYMHISTTTPFMRRKGNYLPNQTLQKKDINRQLSENRVPRHPVLNHDVPHSNSHFKGIPYRYTPFSDRAISIAYLMIIFPHNCCLNPHQSHVSG